MFANKMLQACNNASLQKWTLKILFEHSRLTGIYGYHFFLNLFLIIFTGKGLIKPVKSSKWNKFGWNLEA